MQSKFKFFTIGSEYQSHSGAPIHPRQADLLIFYLLLFLLVFTAALDADAETADHYEDTTECKKKNNQPSRHCRKRNSRVKDQPQKENRLKVSVSFSLRGIWLKKSLKTLFILARIGFIVELVDTYGVVVVVYLVTGWFFKRDWDRVEEFEDTFRAIMMKMTINLWKE